MGKKRQEYIDATANEFNNLYKYYTNIAMNRFKWEVGEQFFEGRHIERWLYEYGKCAFFIDEHLGLMVLPCHTHDKRNVYGDAQKVRMRGFNGQEWVKDVEDVVILRNNILAVPTFKYVRDKCYKIANIQGAIDTNIEGQKTPFIIQGDEKTLLSLKNIWKNKEYNVPVTFTDKQLNMKEAVILPTVAPYVAGNLSDMKVICQNEIMTYLGINNSNIDKKERVLVDETNANNQIILESLDVLLDRRKEVCKKVKEKFDIDLSVEVRKELYGDGHDSTAKETTRAEL